MYAVILLFFNYWLYLIINVVAYVTAVVVVVAGSVAVVANSK